ncbi:desmoplakin-like [Astatotilapia calliptera]|uniref:desmoplakin-like n=1 Tax=Astatotilapia calliptera TaxID=8154 RepID=UPI000E42C880|nr:desmoplakin-like [Astatotilapia calliptera]
MELQKATEDIEISQLKRRVWEQEALLTERQEQLEKLEGEIETQQKTISDLKCQKSQLEHYLNQYHAKLEIAVKDKMAIEQELKHTKMLIEQSEATWSLTQKKLDDFLKDRNDGHDINIQSAGDCKLRSSAFRENDSTMVDVLQQKLEELVLVQRKADMAEEKAQSYKKLLDESNNRLKKLQMDLEAERISMRQKSEELQQETQNMKKSINELQDEIRSLKRAKSSLEQNTFFHSTEIEGLKEQLNIAHGELQKKSSIEQENSYKINSLELNLTSKQSVIDQLKFKCSELTRMNVSSESNIQGLHIQMESMEKERSLSEQKLRSLRREIDSWKQQFQTAKEESSLMKKSEQALQGKCKNLEAELQKSELAASQWQVRVDEIKHINLEMEENLKNIKAKLDQAMMEIDSKDQQIKIFRAQVESTKSQVRIIEEELNKKSQSSHELQIKLQDYSEEVKKMTELQQKIKVLSSSTASYEKEITSLRTELMSVLSDKNSAHMQKAEINDLKVMLNAKNAQLQKECAENQKHLSKIKALEDELFKQKHSFKGLTSTSEKMTENVKQELYTLQSEKRETERKAENLNAKLSDLSSSLQRTKDELAKEAQERKVKESKLIQLEAELQKNRITIKEIMSSSEKSRSNLQNENTFLKREKAEALEKSILLGSEVRKLRENLQHAQSEAEQKQIENAALQLRSQQMEEQLDKCKKMLEELKSKLELQREGYDRQLLLVKTEIERKIILLQSELTNHSEKSKAHSAELAEMLNKYFKQDMKQIKHQSTADSKQQPDQQLQIKMDKVQQERTKLERDLSKAKSQIHELEEEKVELKSKISAMLILYNEQTGEWTKFQQLLKDSEWKLTMKENEARSLREQIVLYIKEVKGLQEKLSTLGLEATQCSFQYVKDNKADLMNADVAIMQTMVHSNQDTKSRRDEEILSVKKSSQMATTENEITLEVIEHVRQDKREIIHSQSLQQDSTTNTMLDSSPYQTPAFLKKDVQSVTYKSHVNTDFQSSVTAQGYMALLGLKDKQLHETNVSKTQMYQSASESSITDRDGQQSVTYSTPQKLPDLKGGVSIQNMVKFRPSDEEYIGKPVAIAGIYVESSKKKISFLEAAEKGFLAKTYALEFLEAQAATGSLTDLATGQTHSAAEALERGIIDPSLKDRLMEAEKAISGYIFKGKKLSVFQAMEERILNRYKAKKILEVQVATGGLINPATGVRVTAHIAVDQGLLNKETLQSLYDPVSNPKGYHNPDTGQKAYYSDILKACLYDISGGVFLFPFGERHLTSTSPASSHRVSVVNSNCGTEMSAYEAFKGKHIDKKTYLFLSQQESEWQEKSTADPSGTPLHVITDVKGGRQLCLESALSQRFLESSELESYRRGLLSITEIADMIFSRMVVVEDVNSPIAGLWDVTQKKRLSVFQGFQQGFTDRATALRLLEAQACTGGICDPSCGERVTLTEALKRGLLDEALSQQLLQFDQALNGFIHPKTAKTLSVSQAVQENLLPKDAGFRCIEFQLLTGGLIKPDTHDRISLEEVVQSGLVDKVTATVLKDEKFHTKSLTCPRTKRRITFKEALERSVYDCHTGLRLLEATKSHGFGPKSTFHYVWAYK